MKSRTTSPDHISANLTKRLVAMIYDGFLLIAISMAYAAIVLAIKINFLGLILEKGAKAEMGIVGFLGWMVLLILFYCYFWRQFGQTLGMKAWQLELIHVNGGRASRLQCVARSITATLSLLFFGVGYWWFLFDAEKITLHDKLTNTRVIQSPKIKNKSKD